MSETKAKILDLAACFTQERGYGGFSYLDLAAEIGIKSASIHYYFKNKDDLAVALVEHTHESHMQSFQQMDATIKRPQDRLAAVIAYFQNYVAENKFCLCGMIAAELHSVSDRVRKGLNTYFADFQIWVAKQFEEMGKKNATLQAMRFLSTLEGALLLARLQGNPTIVGDMLSEHLES